MGYQSCIYRRHTCIGMVMVKVLNNELDDLIQACGHGDRSAFEKLYQATSSKLFGGALRLLRDHNLAQDALQEGYIKIWRNADKFDPSKGAAMSWLSIIVRRAALDRLPSGHVHIDIDDVELAAPAVAPADPGLARCLEKLPDLHRKALLYSYVYGYNHDEIAEMLQKPVGTIKSWVRRSGILLRECLET
jgi:RNA polymerase sigma-70 factor, ECF subfamily